METTVIIMLIAVVIGWLFALSMWFSTE